MEEFSVKGRHDACIALRCPVVVEAAAAIAIADIL
jgi:chorismate synthase